MADDASPGFFSSLMGGIGGLLGLKDAPPDPNAQQKGETDLDFAARRQNARFAKMKDEVDGLLKQYPASGDFPQGEDFAKALRGIRQRGFDQREEDAIIQTFAGEHGRQKGALNFALRGGSEEWQPRDDPGKGGALGAYDPETPQKPETRRDAEAYQRLLDNWNQSGRSGLGYAIGKDKRGRARIVTAPDIGTGV